MRSDNVTVFIGEFFDLVSKQFGMGMIRTWEDLIRNLQQRPSAFLLDEFGGLSSAVLNHLVSKLHLLANTVAAHVRFVVCSPQMIDIILASRGVNPKFSRKWVSVCMQPLDSNEIKQLIALLPEPMRGIAFEYSDDILKFSSGHPRSVQCICSRMFDKSNSTITESDVIKLIRNTENYQCQ